MAFLPPSARSVLKKLSLRGTHTVDASSSAQTELRPTELQPTVILQEILGLEKVNRCFQPDIWRAPRFYIGPDAKVIELSLKAPAGRGFDRHNLIHRIV